jgi:type IV fimbrial biogenesis protein FimT
MLRAHAGRGFTLIELMVTLTLASILMVVAIPAVFSWVADARVRTAGETLQNAVRVAQGEAIRRSRSAVLVLTNATPALNAAPAANGQRWYVQTVQRASDGAAELASLYVRGGTEPASKNVSVTGPSVVCFNAFGQLTSLTAAQTGLGVACDTKLPKTYALSASGTTRNLNVQIGLGGQVRMCDPARTLSDTTPDGC